MKQRWKNVFQENFTLIYPSDRAGAFQSFEYENILLDQQGDCQHIQVFETEALGNVLVLDGVVQCTELDEFIYHEMLVHVPMFSVPEPKRVLIIGGGDGGSLREVLKHKDVEQVIVCEIDKGVVAAGYEFFNAQDSFEDARVKVVYEDAADYLSRLSPEFDVIIVDSTDATTTGGKSLFTKHFANNMTSHLADNGAISIMAGVPMAQTLEHMNNINKMMRFNSFKPRLYTTDVPTYYGGLTAMYLYRNNEFWLPVPPSPDMKFKHYTAEVHEAAFVLPKWLKEMENGN